MLKNIDAAPLKTMLKIGVRSALTRVKKNWAASAHSAVAMRNPHPRGRTFIWTLYNETREQKPAGLSIRDLRTLSFRSAFFEYEPNDLHHPCVWRHHDERAVTTHFDRGEPCITTYDSMDGAVFGGS